MSLPFGVTAHGFLAKDLDTIRAELEEGFRAIFGNVNTAAGPFHQLIGFMAQREREAWELAESVYTANDPDGASGAALDAVSAVSGTEREAATRSRVTLTVTLEAAVTVPAGSVVSVSGSPLARFRTMAAVTSTTAGDYDVEAEGEETGAVAAAAGTLTEIETPISGWSAVTNDEDAVPGTEEEDDASLRARREDELAAQGTSPADAIRADLLDLEGVVSVSVFENTSDATDGDGLPPHSIEALVWDGSSGGTIVDADTIAQTIWDTKAAGIETYGTSEGTAIAADGTERTVRFSRPTERGIYLTFEIDTVAALGWGDGSADELEEAAVETGRARFGVGADVIVSRFVPAAFGVDGVLDVTAIKAGFSVSPSGTANLTIGRREIATFDTTRIVVTATPTEPS